jgi:hypothetical protein
MQEDNSVEIRAIRVNPVRLIANKPAPSVTVELLLDFCKVHFGEPFMGLLPIDIDDRRSISGHGGSDHARDRRVPDHRPGSDGRIRTRLRQ